MLKIQMQVIKPKLVRGKHRFRIWLPLSLLEMLNI